MIYTQFPSIKGLGQQLQAKDGYKGGVNGILLHSSLAVRSDGVPLGLLKQTFFTYEYWQTTSQSPATEVAGMKKGDFNHA